MHLYQRRSPEENKQKERTFAGEEKRKHKRKCFIRVHSRERKKKKKTNAPIRRSHNCLEVQKNERKKATRTHLYYCRRSKQGKEERSFNSRSHNRTKEKKRGTNAPTARVLSTATYIARQVEGKYERTVPYIVQKEENKEEFEQK